MQLFPASFQSFDEEWAGMQLFSAGGEEGLCTEPPAAPGREITAGTGSGRGNMAGK